MKKVRGQQSIVPRSAGLFSDTLKVPYTFSGDRTGDRLGLSAVAADGRALSEAAGDERMARLGCFYVRYMDD